MRYLFGFFLLLFTVHSIALSARPPVAGRAWIRLKANVPFTTAIETLGLPGNARLSHAMLLPEQCMRFNSRTRQIEPASAGKNYSVSATTVDSLEQLLLRTIVVDFDSTMSVAAFCAQVRKRCTEVEYCYPVFENRKSFVPNDPKYGQQGYLQTIQAEQAWDINRGDTSVVIAISDDAIRRTHEDLASNVAVNKAEIPGNNIDDDNNGYVDDYAGVNLFATQEHSAGDNTFVPQDSHGTCVASIACAVQGNQKGYAGVAGLCRFIPIKASYAGNGEDYIDAGYESLIYAALRGARIVNCSWGNSDQGYNPLEQTVVNYVISRGTCIIAAAGNTNDANTPTSVFYPAAYSGVLGVGETTAQSRLTDASTLGSHCRIVAPGDGINTASYKGDDSYTDTDGTGTFAGTSSATPIVSGVAGLVLSEFPDLSPLQLAEHLHVTGDDVTGQNPSWSLFIPRQVNAKNALSRDPMQSPGIVVLSSELRNSAGKVIQNDVVGDTVHVRFRLHNYLGAASNCQLSLVLADPLGTNAVYIPDQSQNIAQLARNADTTTADFDLIIMQYSAEHVFLRLNMHATGEGGAEYSDFALVEFTPTKDYVDLSDGNALVSVGDYGWMGSNQFTFATRKGNGFSTRNLGNMLYRGGVICSSDENFGRTGLGSDAMQANDFTYISRTEPYPYVLTYTDQNSQQGNPMGIELQNSFRWLPGSLLRCDVTIRNTGLNTLHHFALGYYCDWDITTEGTNSFVRRYNEIEAQNLASAAELEFHQTVRTACASLAISSDTDAVAQAAGMGQKFVSGNFSVDSMFAALHEGTSIQYSGPDDMSTLVGMMFTTPFEPGQERHASFVFGIGGSIDSLTTAFNTALDDVPSDAQPPADMVISPQPADQTLQIRLLRPAQSCQVYSLRGECVLSWHPEPNDVWIRRDVHTLPDGCYVLRVTAGDHYSQQLVRIIH